MVSRPQPVSRPSPLTSNGAGSQWGRSPGLPIPQPALIEVSGRRLLLFASVARLMALVPGAPTRRPRAWGHKFQKRNNYREDRESSPVHPSGVRRAPEVESLKRRPRGRHAERLSQRKNTVSYLLSVSPSVRQSEYGSDRFGCPFAWGSVGPIDLRNNSCKCKKNRDRRGL